MKNHDKETSQEVAYNKILKKIISERLLPGTPLRQEHVAKELGLSATPVREAFKRLEHEGWLQNIPYCGTSIKKFEYDEIKDIYLLREAIEGVAIREAARNATEYDCISISQALQAEGNYILQLENNASNRHVILEPPFDSDLDFHRSILNASHSKLLIQRSEVLQAQFSCIVLTHEFKTSLEELKEVYSEHSLIFQAMRKGWADIAEQMIRKHMIKARKNHLNFLDKKLSKQAIK